MDWFSTFLTGQVAGIWLILFYAFLIIFGGGGLFFLLIRPVVLWYFKLKSIEKKLEENNKLQAQILEQLKIFNCWSGDEVDRYCSRAAKTSSTSEESKKDYSAYMPK